MKKLFDINTIFNIVFPIFYFNNILYNVIVYQVLRLYKVRFDFNNKFCIIMNVFTGINYIYY